MIATGSNSGFQAINLAALMGANPIVLMGFDMGVEPGGRTHFFGDHPTPELQRPSPFGLFIRAFERAAPIYQQRGVVILNASARTALTCFRRIAPDRIAEHLGPP